MICTSFHLIEVYHPENKITVCLIFFSKSILANCELSQEANALIVFQSADVLGPLKGYNESIQHENSCG
jgi:hypothetical protein